MDIILQRLLIGFGVTLIFGIIAFMREMVDDSGFFVGVITFTLMYVFLDWQAYAIVVVFFLLTGVSIDIENRDKSNKGEFELYKAKRPMERVLGRSLAGAIFGGLFFLTSRPEFKLAFMASYAEAVFDTVSTKLGKMLSKDARLITNFQIVHHGTPGGISLQGTLCGIFAAVILSGTGIFIRLIKLNELFVVLIGAFAGSAIDSYLNLFSYQKRRIPNEFINFFSSMLAGLIAIWFVWVFNMIFGVD